MEILEIKKGTVDVENIEKYNSLTRSITFWRKRLNCVTEEKFKCEYFKVGDYSSCSGKTENEHYITLGESPRDKRVKQALVDFLTCKIIESLNDLITELNSIIK